MSRFTADPHGFFDNVYRGPAPWDVGAPQPDLVDLLRDQPPTGPVLDIGCGTGDLAIALAGEGLEVVGIDFVEAAILEARDRRSRLAPNAQLAFEVADALKPSSLGRRFGAVVDSGFYHLFDPDQCELLVEELARTLLPGGQYYMLEFATEFPQTHSPRAVTEEELRGRFTSAAGWRILEVRPARFLSRIAPVPAIAACIERDADSAAAGDQAR